MPKDMRKTSIYQAYLIVHGINEWLNLRNLALGDAESTRSYSTLVFLPPYSYFLLSLQQDRA
jgi:hypothetical protein